MIQPTSFSEALRLRFTNALIAAGVAIGLAALAIVAVLVWGGWPASLYGEIIHILGKVLMGAGAAMILVIIFLGLGGPVKAVKLLLGKFSIETERDE